MKKQIARQDRQIGFFMLLFFILLVGIIFYTYASLVGGVDRAVGQILGFWDSKFK